MKFISIIICCLLLTACGFHLRGTGNLPPQLHRLQFDVAKPDAPFNQQLRALLLSLKIHLTDNAPLTLHASYAFKHSTPKVTSSTQLVTFQFGLLVNVVIYDKTGNIIVPTHVFSLHKSLEINSNQIYTPNVATLVEEQLQRDAITAIYFWLTSKNTRTALATPPGTVATPPPPAATTSPITPQCAACNSN